MQQKQQMMAQQSLVNQAGQIIGSPMMDPSKNPEGTAQMGEIIADQAQGIVQQQQPPGG